MLLRLSGFFCKLFSSSMHKKCHKDKVINLELGTPLFRHILFYSDENNVCQKNDAEIYYYNSGIYEVVSNRYCHYGLYIMQGKLSDVTYTLRYLSFPSLGGKKKPSFHLCNFINKPKSKVFVQRTIVSKGELIHTLNGIFVAETSIKSS